MKVCRVPLRFIPRSSCTQHRPHFRQLQFSSYEVNAILFYLSCMNWARKITRNQYIWRHWTWLEKSKVKQQGVTYMCSCIAEKAAWPFWTVESRSAEFHCWATCEVAPALVPQSCWWCSLLPHLQGWLWSFQICRMRKSRSHRMGWPRSSFLMIQQMLKLKQSETNMTQKWDYSITSNDIVWIYGVEVLFSIVNKILN